MTMLCAPSLRISLTSSKTGREASDGSANAPAVLDDIDCVGGQLDDRVLDDFGRVARDVVVEGRREHGLGKVFAVREDQAAGSATPCQLTEPLRQLVSPSPPS